MSVPRVHNDSARVAVHLIAPADSVNAYQKTWDLLLLKQANAWGVVEHPHSRVAY